MPNTRWWSAALTLTVLTGCVVVHPGEVGVKSRLGRMDPVVYEPGPVALNPFVSRVTILPTRTVNLEVALSLPSSDGLNVRSEISILYSIRPEMAGEIVSEIGSDYEQVVILSVFRSAAADVSARYEAQAMYTAARSDIEAGIQARMAELLEPRGFTVESVLLKSIELPEGLRTAIEDKLEAEQEAQRMEFVLLQEEQEAERRRIEAEGIAAAQLILAESLTDEVLAYQSLEVYRDLAQSQNAKIILTDGQLPLLIPEPSAD
jgi:regulator of protease activity HflC (stomatin/prohibitin superfamily)